MQSIECVAVELWAIEVDWRIERDASWSERGNGAAWHGVLDVYGNSECDEKAENWKSIEQWQSYWLQSMLWWDVAVDGMVSKPSGVSLFVGRHAKQVIEISFFPSTLSHSPFFPILFNSLFPLIPWIFLSLSSFSVADYHHSDTVPLLLLLYG